MSGVTLGSGVVAPRVGSMPGRAGGGGGGGAGEEGGGVTAMKVGGSVERRGAPVGVGPGVSGVGKGINVSVALKGRVQVGTGVRADRAEMGSASKRHAERNSRAQSNSRRGVFIGGYCSRIRYGCPGRNPFFRRQRGGDPGFWARAH